MIKKILLTILPILLLLFPFPLYAETGSFDATFGAIYILIRVGAFFAALLLAFFGIKKLVDYATDNRNPKNSPMSSLVMFLASGLLLNVDASLSIMINTITQSGDYCYYGDLSGVSESPLGNNSSCFAEAKTITADLTNQLKKQNENTESIEKLQEKLRMLFTIFQLVGLIYMLKAASEGAQQASYGKILMMIIASAAVIDMPHTIDILINTITEILATIYAVTKLL